MEISLAVVADYANVSREGKLNILGIFGSVHPRTFPAVLPHSFVVLRLSGTIEEKGSRHRLRLALTDPDGRLLSELSGNLEIPVEGPPEPPEVNLILGSGPLLTFHCEGPHELSVGSEGQEPRKIRIMVMRPAPIEG